MPYAIWSDMYKLDVPAIDAQHRQLLDIINHFHGAVKSGSKPSLIFETLNALIHYVQMHFAAEEAIMDQPCYPVETAKQHKVLHERLVTDIFKLQEQLTGTGNTIVYDLEAFLNSWLIQHILLVDKHLGACLSQRKDPDARSGVVPAKN